MLCCSHKAYTPFKIIKLNPFRFPSRPLSGEVLTLLKNDFVMFTKANWHAIIQWYYCVGLLFVRLNLTKAEKAEKCEFVSLYCRAPINCDESIIHERWWALLFRIPMFSCYLSKTNIRYLAPFSKQQKWLIVNLWFNPNYYCIIINSWPLLVHS